MAVEFMKTIKVLVNLSRQRFYIRLKESQETLKIQAFPNWKFSKLEKVMPWTCDEFYLQRIE